MNIIMIIYIIGVILFILPFTLITAYSPTKRKFDVEMIDFVVGILASGLWFILLPLILTYGIIKCISELLNNKINQKKGSE